MKNDVFLHGRFVRVEPKSWEGGCALRLEFSGCYEGMHFRILALRPWYILSVKSQKGVYNAKWTSFDALNSRVKGKLSSTIFLVNIFLNLRTALFF